MKLLLRSGSDGRVEKFLADRMADDGGRGE